MASFQSLLAEHQFLIADTSLGESLFSIIPDTDGAEIATSPVSIGTAAVSDTVSAGATLVLTNSFDLNRSRLSMLGVGLCSDTYNERAARSIHCSLEGKLDRVMIVGSIGPAAFTYSAESMTADFADQATALAKGGAKAFWLESFSDAAQIRAAVEGCRRGAPAYPLIVTVGFRPEWSPEAQELEKVLHTLDVFAIGADTGNGDANIIARIQQLRNANPSARLALKFDLDTIVQRRSVKMPSLALVKQFTEEALDAGVQIMGVGTSSSLTHVRTMAEALRMRNSSSA